MFQDDMSYYQHRAQVEVERALEAGRPDVARVHYDLAAAYLGKLAPRKSVRPEA